MEDIYQATNSPDDTMHRGSNFINMGRMNRDWLTGGSHAIILPVEIDMIAKSIIGVIIFVCSSVFISGAPEFEPHIVTNLNRIE